MKKIVAIHQPNFFPWLGFFQKIKLSHKFILLDHVQYQKTGGAWQNRVKMHVGGTGKWVTAPIIRSYQGVRSVNEMELQQSVKWRDKMWKTITSSYSKHPYFAETVRIIEPLLLNEESNISRYNTRAITTISEQLGIETSKISLSSELPYVGSSNEMLVSLTKAVDCGVYLCGGGADRYQDESLFSINGIELRYQDFQHPVYEQYGQVNFVTGLSIVDPLMNVGVDGVRSLLNIQA